MGGWVGGGVYKLLIVFVNTHTIYTHTQHMQNPLTRYTHIHKNTHTQYNLIIHTPVELHPPQTQQDCMLLLLPKHYEYEVHVYVFDNA